MGKQKKDKNKQGDNTEKKIRNKYSESLGRPSKHKKPQSKNQKKKSKPSQLKKSQSSLIQSHQEQNQKDEFKISSELLQQQSIQQQKVQEESQNEAKIQMTLKRKQRKIFNSLIGLFCHFFENLSSEQNKKIIHGFCFLKKQDRQKLKKENPNIKWHLENIWIKTEEQQKIAKMLEKEQFRKISENEKQRQIFIKVCLQVSSISCEEASNQFYKIFGEIWLNSINQYTKVEELINKIIKNVDNQFPFFSYNFSKLYYVNREILSKELFILLNEILKIITVEIRKEYLKS